MKVPIETRTCAAPNCDVTFECEVTSVRKYCCGGHNKKGVYAPREIRFCECNCGKTFECRVTSKQRFIRGHNRRKHVSIETRICACGCKGTFECRIDSEQKFLCGHGNRGKSINRLKTPLALEVEAILSGEKEAPFCNCGCGGRIVIKPHHSWAGIPKYIHGHNQKGKVSPKKDRTYEEMYGKVKAGEIRQKQGMPGDNNPAKRPEARAKISAFKFDYHREHPGIMKGENSPSWQGGISNEPYPFGFDEELKESIRERDNNICQLCGRTKEEEGRNLAVHHIDYNKDNLDLDNLITLCCSCNCRVNHSREYWTIFFQGKIELIYGVLI